MMLVMGVLAACSGTPAYAQGFPMDTAHLKTVKVAQDSLAAAEAVTGRLVLQLRVADSLHLRTSRILADSMSKQAAIVARQLAKMRSADSAMLRVVMPKASEIPKGISCDSLAKWLVGKGFNGGVTTTQALQDANAKCR
jgi:hypothetical protein